MVIFAKNTDHDSNTIHNKQLGGADNYEYADIHYYTELLLVFHQMTFLVRLLSSVVSLDQH